MWQTISMDYLPHLLTNLPAFRLTSDFYKILIFSRNRRKLSVGALLDDLSVIHDENLVGLLDCGEPVGNRHDGFAFREFRQRRLDQMLVFRVDAGGRFIEDDNRGIQKHTGPNIKQNTNCTIH